MKQQTFEKVYFADTDSYGVTWHGTYLRWMEIGRTQYCDSIGCNLAELAKQDIHFPIVNIDIKYKSPAKLFDEIVIETEIVEVSKLSVTFNQVIKNKLTDKVYTTAKVKSVAVHMDGSLYRCFPPQILKLFNKNTLV